MISPDSDVKRRFAKRFEDLTAVLPYCDEVTFYDNENGFAAVAEYKNGEILQIGGRTPEWLAELKEIAGKLENESDKSANKTADRKCK